MNLHQIIALLTRFKNTHRRIWPEYGIEFQESIAEHSMHVALMCHVIGQDKPFEKNVLLPMSLLHGIPAILISDFPSFHDASILKAFLKNEKFVQRQVESIFSNPDEVMTFLKDFYGKNNAEARFIFQIKACETLLQAEKIRNSKNAEKVSDLYHDLHPLILDNDLITILQENG
ncbi:MAG: HD domain-containing protein [Candidatus Helarchaeota archaeon]